MRTETSGRSVSDSVSERVVSVLRKAASKKFSAFTLAELIVVVTILAILATVGFLALSGYSQDAKDASVKANVRSVMTAISAESAAANVSPRYFVDHDPAASLSGGAVAYVDGNPVVLTGGAFGTANTNYSAGNPDWAKLKLNPEKFRLSSLGSRFASAFRGFGAEGAEAAYDPKAVAVGAFDAAFAPTPNGRARSASYFQVAGVVQATGLASVAGNFPAGFGGIAGLVRNPVSSGMHDALVENASYYPGCDTADILLANGQRWAACNVWATEAWTGDVPFVGTGGESSTDQNSALRYTLGSYFQWGRNRDVTALPHLAGWVISDLGAYFYTGSSATLEDWLSPGNDNLWGGTGSSLWSGTYATQPSADRILMKGPCAEGYHVPTQAEWWNAISALNSVLTNTGTYQNDTIVASTLKLPFSWRRAHSAATYGLQGTYGYYWSSSPAGKSSYRVHITAQKIAPALIHNRAGGISIRCLKN